MPTAKATKKKPVPRKPAPTPRLTLPAVMRELEQAGTATTRKTYLRHGAKEPLFGVSFATLKDLTKRIDIDHELALALWNTGNFDARNLAVKIVDPARMTASELDRWVREATVARLGGSYVAMLAAEGSHAIAKVSAWLAAKDMPSRSAGWILLGQLAQRDETLPDSFFATHLAEIERTMHTAPNGEREPMNGAVITIGGRSAGLRKAALAAAKRIGKVEIDHGDTACKTADAGEVIEKTWAHAKTKGFASPAAQERTRETPRRRC